jgi:hypothetical protein
MLSLSEKRLPLAVRLQSEVFMTRFLAIILLTVPATAATLDDVRAAVRRLEAKQPVRATLTIDQHVKTAGKYANDTAKRLATADVAHDANGISITIPQALLEEARKAPTAQDAIGSIRTLSVIEALDFRETLLSLLEGAVVTEEKRVVLGPTPARLLVLKLNPRPRRQSNSITIGSVKNDEKMRLWIADDSVPLAAERDQNTTAGFMFIKGTFTGHTKYTFARVNDRLVLARMESREGGSGIGQKFDRQSVQTIAVH